MIALSDLTKTKCWHCFKHFYRDSVSVITAKSCFLIYTATDFILHASPLSGRETQFGLDEGLMRDMRKAKTHESFIQGQGDFRSPVISATFLL